MTNLDQKWPRIIQFVHIGRFSVGKKGGKGTDTIKLPPFPTQYASLLIVDASREFQFSLKTDEVHKGVHFFGYQTLTYSPSQRKQFLYFL